MFNNKIAQEFNNKNITANNNSNSNENSNEDDSDKLIAYKRSFVFAPSGLLNVGNICYFNSLMQCILSCPSIFEVLNIKRTSYSVRNNQLAKNLLELYDAHKRGDDISRLCIPIWNLVIQAAQKRNDLTKMDSYNQHDAHEGLLILLELLEDIPDIIRLFEHRKLIKVLCEYCKKWCVKKEETNLVFEVEPDLKVPQLEEFKKITKESLDLNEFLLKQDSYVDNDHVCAFCKQRGAKYKTTVLTMIPEIIVVVLKKYNNKVNTFFPEFLTFKKKCARNTKMVYKLVAQSEHGGNMSGGHYWAICLRKQDSGALSWYRLDDSSVSPANYAPTENSYMLFYHFSHED